MLDNVVYLDLETTGGSATHDRIIEIGLVAVENGRVVDEWSTLVNPGRRIPHAIQALTGITDDMVAAAPRFESLGRELFARLDGRLLAAHNARFDYGFLRHEFARAGMRYRAPVLCTVKLSRKLFPQHRLHNLDALITRHALFCLDRHRALGDARALWELSTIWRRELGVAHVDGVCADMLRPPVLPAHLPPDFLDDVPEAPGVYVLCGSDGTALYVGHAANLRSRTIAHFAGAAAGGRDAELAARVARLEWTETAGELGARLREAALVRTLAPVYNRNVAGADAFTWHWDPAAVEPRATLIDARSADLGRCDRLFGMFRSRASARQALRGLAEAHALCQVALGLETAEAGEPCDAHRAGRCRGACTGAESALRHALRVTQALTKLRVRRWPYPGPIAVREHAAFGEATEFHVLDRWSYLGTARCESELHELSAASAQCVFDPGVYRMLSGFLQSPPASCEIVQLERVACV